MGEGQRKNEQQPHAKSSCCATMQSEFKAEWSALPCACRQRLEGLPNAWRSRWSTKRQAEWKLPARRSTNDVTDAVRLIGLLARLARD